MRLSEIGDKEIIDLTKGSRHGAVWDAEMLFNQKDGKITALIVPEFQGKSRFSQLRGTTELPWDSIINIGDDLIIFKS